MISEDSNYKPAIDTGAHSKSSLAKRQQQKERQKKIKQATEVCMKYVDKNNSKGLIVHLERIESDRIRIDEIVDQDGFSLLHMSVFKNKAKVFDAIMDKARKDLTPHELNEWVNL